MAVMTAACLLAVIEGVIGYRGLAIGLALGVVAVGSLHTIGRRLLRIRRGLEAR
jgi:hypothetical protein